jgi:hypothetical protein
MWIYSLEKLLLQKFAYRKRLCLNKGRPGVRKISTSDTFVRSAFEIEYVTALIQDLKRRHDAKEKLFCPLRAEWL